MWKCVACALHTHFFHRKERTQFCWALFGLDGAATAMSFSVDSKELARLVKCTFDNATEEVMYCHRVPPLPPLLPCTPIISTNCCRLSVSTTCRAGRRLDAYLFLGQWVHTCVQSGFLPEGSCLSMNAQGSRSQDDICLFHAIIILFSVVASLHGVDMAGRQT